MDYVLQKATRAYMMSMVDGFSGYNQVAVDQEDQKKSTFTTPLGHLHVCKDAIWSYECKCNFLEGHGHSVCWGQVCGYIFG